MMKPFFLGVLLSLASASQAGPLDLDVYASLRPPPSPGRSPMQMPRELWQPGSPLALRGESPGIVAFSHAGYAAMGAVGLAQSLDSLGKDPNAGRNAVGFGLITAIQLWTGWHSLRETRAGPPGRPRR
ncbi:MAG: hypothetical protein HY927_12900 [Elusimicrobia bacterium]|nr:hypothetical protein [Elusimicrobiota bacterium]